MGGCTRDLMLGKSPKDWDLTTNAKPEEIQEIFPDHYANNDYGTVGVKTESESHQVPFINLAYVFANFPLVPKGLILLTSFS